MSTANIDNADLTPADMEVVDTAAEVAGLHPPALVAVDDGHSETKVAFFSGVDRGEIRTFSFPSRTARDLVEVESSGAQAPNAYRVSDGAEEVVTILPRGKNTEDAGDNRTQDYPTSVRNRVVVHHALHEVLPLLGARGDVLSIGTTLPYSDFYLPVNGAQNAALIEAKKTNIARGVHLVDREDLSSQPSPYRVAQHRVYSEGVAAFFDAMLLCRADGTITVNEDFAQRFAYGPAFVVVDVGGKTTDIVYGNWSGRLSEAPTLTVAKSESIKAGCLDACDDLESFIKSKFSIRNVVDPERCLVERIVPLYGKTRDISDLVERAMKPLADKVQEAVYRHAEDGSALSCVIYVGGGSLLLQSHLEGLFHPDLMVFPDQPRFANARGILKVMKATSG
ncbi:MULTISPECIES: ParM/StbA family protein [unclassified Xanthobacter]|uniref:ParM/StbA family protein n=1 Tax=unclassified Xanthobacter TaxID=2623496 RepID=UPI001F1B1701|nr:MULTISPECIES: ParM/StbA family protein [unclassified Xanthobacter]